MPTPAATPRQPSDPGEQGSEGGRDAVVEGAVAPERAQLEALVLQMPIPLALHVGPEHRIALVNDAYRRISAGRDIVGLTPAEAFPDLTDTGVLAQFDAVMRTGDAWVAREVHARYDRSGTGVEDTWYDLRFEPVRDAEGRVIGVLNFSVDVTEQVRARHVVEEAQRAAERAAATLAVRDTRYRALFDALDAGFCVVELVVDGRGEAVDYRFVETNPAFVAQTGLADPVGRMARDLVPGLEPNWVQTYAHIAATGESLRFERGSDAMGRWFDVFAFRLGEPAERRVAMYFHDVTTSKAAARERDQLLAALELERSRLAYVFRHAPSFLAVLRGPEYVFTLANDAYYQLVGHREILGKPLWEALPEVRGQGFEALLDQVIATGTPFVGREMPVTVARTAGASPEQRFVDLSYLPLVESDGARAGIIAHGSDVTDHVLARREVERLLTESERARGAAQSAQADAEAARAEAEAANRVKGEFLAVMSHELRTPLNAIGGYAELMELGIRGPVTPQQREDLGRIQRSQRHLLGLVNEVLNYARLETGAVAFTVETLRVHEMLADAEGLVAPQARAKGIALGPHACPAALYVRADAEKLRQILVNLLSNSVKFTDRGGSIRIRCDAPDPREGAPRTVRIAVADTGMGIPAHKLAVIFEPFVQVRSDLTRTADGAGLGLAISRDLARGMGGELTVESVLGHGSVFTLTLPAAPLPSDG